MFSVKIASTIAMGLCASCVDDRCEDCRGDCDCSHPCFASSQLPYGLQMSADVNQRYATSI